MNFQPFQSGSVISASAREANHHGDGFGAGKADKATGCFERVRIAGKFLMLGDEPFMVRGVTYGPFRPDEHGCEYGTRASVKRDFALMARHGFNSVRVYTVPPRWLLDEARENNLRVMVGLPWEQHVAFLDDAKIRADIISRVRDYVASCAGHPAVFCFVIGNEIPSPIVRWHGRRKISAFLRTLYDTVKEVDKDALTTYVNYPSTEYLDCSFGDFFCFNVYLEQREALEAYLARLQNLSNNKPLVLAEVGLDSMRNGEEAQAETLRWQLRTVFDSGASGIFVFSWTDEWFRGGHDIDDWAFGLTTVSREPKAALADVEETFRTVPFPDSLEWPAISVLVCTYNGSATIRECLEGLFALEYPDFEIIVVNDGSTDGTEAIVGEFDVKLISISNGGLSNARNVAAEAATGEYVVYIDDDAFPPKYWLKYIARAFGTSDFAALGGPNLPPYHQGWRADCVTNSPGGPTHVLLSDREAEHIPGCNMAYRRDVLLELGGFDAQFCIAGDDVDLCWRLQMSGHRIGFSAAAFVWHYRRSSLRAYLRQQYNYGKAEAMLEAKWPQRYNAVGHVPWEGRIYGCSVHRDFFSGRSRIYHGVFGMAPFQRVYEPTNDLLRAIIQMPEWYLFMLSLGVLCGLSLIWPPLFLAAPALLLTVLVVLLEAVLGGVHAEFYNPNANRWLRGMQRTVVAVLHILQPLVRLLGRWRGGLTPWRRRGADGLCIPRTKHYALWFEEWQDYDTHIANLGQRLRKEGMVVYPAGDYSEYDFHARGGILGGASLVMAIEEHGDGKQLARFRVRPRLRRRAAILGLFLATLSVLACLDAAWGAAAILALLTLLTAVRTMYECVNSIVSSHVALQSLGAAVELDTASASDQGR